MVNRITQIASAIALAFAVTGSVAAQDQQAVDGAGVLANDTSVEGLTRHTIEVFKNQDTILGDLSAIMNEQHVDAVAKEQEEYFQSLLQAATSYSEDAMNAASEKYGLHPEAKQGGIAASRGDEGVRYRLFISMGMGEGALTQAMNYAIKHKENMVLSLRGPMPGEKLDPMVYRLMNMIGGVKEGMTVPNIEINPPAFTDSSVTTVPTLVALDADGKVLAKVAGVMNPEWIESEVQAGRIGDLGKHGGTTNIAEIDMMEAMIAKAKAEDPQALADKARKDIWKGIPVYSMPAVTEARVRELDAGFTVTEDIPLPDGTFLARKGDYFNPLDNEDFFFPEAIVVIDATKADQVRFAVAMSQGLKDAGVITLMSDLDRENGWDVLATLTNQLGDQPFMLTNDVQERFRIERVPTVITVVDKKILVQEIPTSVMEISK